MIKYDAALKCIKMTVDEWKGYQESIRKKKISQGKSQCGNYKYWRSFGINPSWIPIKIEDADEPGKIRIIFYYEKYHSHSKYHSHLNHNKNYNDNDHEMDSKPKEESQ